MSSVIELTGMDDDGVQMSARIQRGAGHGDMPVRLEVWKAMETDPESGRALDWEQVESVDVETVEQAQRIAAEYMDVTDGHEINEQDQVVG